MPEQPTAATLNDQVARLAEALIRQGWLLATAESCTGGLIAATCTDMAGSSLWFDRAVVTYSNQAKIDLLGVPAALIEQHGAVSEAVVRAMAEGLLARSPAHIALSVSGVAGPGGGSPDKPVGTVWLGCAVRGGATVAVKCWWPGDRQDVRWAAVAKAIDMALHSAVACPPRP
jgi:nicotinamide-nucleotide amidase